MVVSGRRVCSRKVWSRWRPTGVSKRVGSIISMREKAVVVHKTLGLHVETAHSNLAGAGHPRHDRHHGEELVFPQKQADQHSCAWCPHLILTFERPKLRLESSLGSSTDRRSGTIVRWGAKYHCQGEVSKYQYNQEKVGRKEKEKQKETSISSSSISVGEEDSH